MHATSNAHAKRAVLLAFFALASLRTANEPAANAPAAAARAQPVPTTRQRTNAPAAHAVSAAASATCTNAPSRHRHAQRATRAHANSPQAPADCVNSSAANGKEAALRRRALSDPSASRAQAAKNVPDVLAYWKGNCSRPALTAPSTPPGIDIKASPSTAMATPSQTTARIVLARAASGSTACRNASAATANQGADSATPVSVRPWTALLARLHAPTPAISREIAMLPSRLPRARAETIAENAAHPAASRPTTHEAAA